MLTNIVDCQLKLVKVQMLYSEVNLSNNMIKRLFGVPILVCVVREKRLERKWIQGENKFQMQTITLNQLVYLEWILRSRDWQSAIEVKWKIMPVSNASLDDFRENIYCDYKKVFHC